MVSKILLALLVLFLGVNPVYADKKDNIQSDIRISQIEEKMNNLRNELDELKLQQAGLQEKAQETEVIKDEVRKLRLESAIPEIEYKSYSGLGPAASKVYFVPRGLSIGGYGEVNYEIFRHSDKTSRGDALKFVPYFGYKFSDSILMNVELEIEHAGIKNISPRQPEVYIEFAYLDFLLHPKFNLRPGLILMPVDRINEYHEPTVYYGVLRPDVERTIIPTVWRELGVMAYGEIVPGLSYKTALVNGLRTDTMSDWISGGRQRGAEVNADKLAGIARLDYEPIRGLNLGVSAYYGGGSDKKGAAEKGTQSAEFQLYVLESQYQLGDWWIKGLYSFGNAKGNDAFKYETASTNRAKSVYGWYVETAYNIMPLMRPDSVMSLSPYARYERYNLHEKVFTGKIPDKTKDRDVVTLGLEFKPHPQVVLKVDYQARDTRSSLPKGKGAGKDENKIDQINLGIGFIF